MARSSSFSPLTASVVVVAFIAMIGHIAYTQLFVWPSKTDRPVMTGMVSSELEVPKSILTPHYYHVKEVPHTYPRQILDEKGIAGVIAAGALAARAMDLARSLIHPGMTTDTLDRAIHAFIIHHNAFPSSLNFGGYPKSICTSVNEVAVHGIPDTRPLLDGDIITVDIAIYLDGYHADMAETIPVGNVSTRASSLIAAAREVFDAAVAVCGPGVPLHRVAEEVQRVARQHKLGVVRSLGGHGIGKEYHALPIVSSYVPWFHREFMVEGLAFTIEPILVEPGGIPHVRVLNDSWTTITADRSLAAQFEHTIVITAAGAVVATKLPPGQTSGDA